MAKPKQPSMFQEWRDAAAKAVEPYGLAVASPEPPAARTEALETFLLGQGVEPPAPPPPTSLHADLWMLGTPTYQRKIAFTESVGGRFGDIGLTSRFILDGWSQTPAGFRWILDPGAVEVPVISSRAADLLDGCFIRTRHGLYKLALAECGGDLDAAIIRAVDEQMTMLGLDRYIPDQPQEAW